MAWASHSAPSTSKLVVAEMVGHPGTRLLQKSENRRRNVQRAPSMSLKQSSVGGATMLLGMTTLCRLPMNVMDRPLNLWAWIVSCTLNNVCLCKYSSASTCVNDQAMSLQLRSYLLLCTWRDSKRVVPANSDVAKGMSVGQQF